MLPQNVQCNDDNTDLHLQHAESELEEDDRALIEEEIPHS